MAFSVPIGIEGLQFIVSGRKGVAGENTELVEEGPMSHAYIKYAIVSVDGYYYRVVYVNRGGCMEYCYAEVVGTPKTTIEWGKAE